MARASALLALSTWIVAYAFWLAIAAIGQPLTARIVAAAAISLSSGFGLSLAIYAVSARTVGVSAWRRVVVLAAAVAVATAAHSLVDTLTLGVALRGDAPLGPMTLPATFLSAFTYLVWAQSFIASAMALLTAAAERLAQERRVAVAEAAARQAQIAALRLQINPHFLFNTLNSAATLVGARRNAEAEELILRLSEFFRGTLEEPDNGQASLAQEFEMLGAYLDIEAVRFGDRLTASLTLPPGLGQARTPPLLIQPLVENAIKHGVAPSKTPIRVEVGARRQGDDLVIRVWNQAGQRAACGSTQAGVGLNNVRARLAALYGDRGSLAISEPDGGFLAEVTLPLSLPGDRP